MPHLIAPPEYIDTFKEIAVVYDDNIPAEFNKLLPEERTFIYYLYRASLPGNRICTDQMHRNGLDVQALFETILKAESTLLSLFKQQSPSLGSINIPKFIQEIKTFLVYLWGNHGQYFLREHADEKRTPARLGLHKLTIQNIQTVLLALNQPELVTQLKALELVIFEQSHQASGVVPNNIEASAHNFYGAGITEADYANIPSNERSGINAYFEVADHETTGRSIIKRSYAVGDKYDKELDAARYWLQKAYDLSLANPLVFDTHLAKSLHFLIQYITTGDEEFFKQHSIEWLQTKSRIDYCFGFIETYDDPKNQRGTFQAEATIRTITLEELSSILPGIESSLPVDKAFKRDLAGKELHLPNASINTKIFGTGGLGPLQITAAYCLPNYEEIRSTNGSKQIIYPSSKSLGSLLNPHLNMRLFFSPADVEWLEEYDHHQTFLNQLWDIHCILHETLGHGSGKLALHTYSEEELTLTNNTTHQPGQTTPVTSDNLADFLLGYDATIEELRAEVIALYVSIVHLDALVQQGFLTEWYHKLGKKVLQKWLMFHMLDSGLMRLLQQSENATEISGDHARANTTIMNYIIDNGGACIQEHSIEDNGKQYTVIALAVSDMNKALTATTALLQEVQRIKSTGDGLAAKKLIERYGIPIKNMEHFKQLKANYKHVVGDLKCKLSLSPILTPRYNADGAMVDIDAAWPKNIFEQWQNFSAITLLKT